MLFLPYSFRIWVEPELRLLSVYSFTYSPCVHVGFLWVLQCLETLQKNVSVCIGCTKWSLDINKSVNLCMCLTINWQPI